ncbi:hypothetical protein, partial [Streptomyces sp. BF23-19]|uniref:hypothetical protein n=1 Tax=Streptomyces sp. BF23-19 TaxID=3240283 RepID=UPI0034E5D9F7
MDTDPDDAALLEGGPQLPYPAERARLREAAGVTQARLAAALKMPSDGEEPGDRRPAPGGVTRGGPPGKEVTCRPAKTLVFGSSPTATRSNERTAQKPLSTQRVVIHLPC